MTPTPNPWGLSPAEARAMTAVCAHGCRKLASRELACSVRTIESHLNKAAEKMPDCRTSLGRVLAWDRWQRAAQQEQAAPITYSTHREGRGVRFELRGQLAAGQKLELTDGCVMTFQGHGPAGMLLCTDADGAEQLLFPQQVKGARPA